MKITKRFIKNLIKEVKGDNRCPSATQENRLNRKNKREASKNPKIKYGHPSKVKELQDLAEQNKLCGSCAAFDISEKMKNCGVKVEKGFGYCKMHDFSCHKDKTCLTYAPGGPKK